MARLPVAEDLLDLGFVSDPQLSPDGLRAACVVTRIVKGEAPAEKGKADGRGKTGKSAGAAYTPPRYQSRIHLFELAETRSKRHRPSEGTVFTRSEYTDSHPRFSPDGSKLAFLSVRKEGEKPQLHVMPLAGGEAVRITDLKAGVGEFAWHPGSGRLAFVSRGDYVDENAERGLPQRIRRRYFRADGGGQRPEVPAQVYLVNAGGGAPVKLTDFEYTPGDLAFSPSGDELYLLVAGNEEADSNFSFDVVKVDLDSKAVTKLAADVPFVGGGTVSPSGRWLYLIAPSVPGDLASPNGLWVIDVSKAGGRGKREPRLLSDVDLDTTPSLGGDSRYGSMPNAPVWYQDPDGGEGLVANSFVDGRTRLARISLDGRLTEIDSEHDAMTSFNTLTGSGRLLFTAESSDKPGELFVRYEDGSEQRLSSINDTWLKRLSLATAEGPFELKPPRKAKKGSYASASRSDHDGRERVQYWTLRSAKPRADEAAVLEVHGGPHTAYGNGFYFEFQLLAARGYSVIYGNPRGGSSYGFSFATSLLGRYGSVDADDVVDIGDDGLARLGTPKAPLHLTGGSYGGFMTNWLVGRTDRYRSAVTQRSISNWTSMYGTSDIGPGFVEREIAGVPWDDLDRLWEQSPIRHVAFVKTPLLIIHSELDFRCPIEQAEQLFTALKHLGKVDVEFLRFPGECHELSRSGRPDRRIANLEAIVGWFETHA